MNPISAITAPALAAVPGPSTPTVSSGFQEILKSSIEAVESDNAHAAHAAHDFLAGENDDIHRVALAAQRAELSSELFLQVRNKIISAYQEIMKMQM